ncbi:MAG: hypothetical protein A2020_08420 [Lentisphaerae bacterium GWF2_45_14]|nr:MAG: hypothetical protein A2020_08420 [Lentisphaerae bacterium GWF2_45_14]
MRKVLQTGITAVFCLVMTIAASTAETGAAPAKKIAFEMDFPSGSPAVIIENIDVIPSLQFYYANSGWGNIHEVDCMRMKRKNHEASIIKKIPGIGNYDLNMKWNGLQLEYDYIYEVPADSKVKYIVADIFLSRDIFSKAPEKGVKTVPGNEFDALGCADSLEFDTILGKFIFTLSSENLTGGAVASQWLLRNTSDQTWRPKKLQSLSILNNCERSSGKPARQKLHVLIRLEPVPDLAERLNGRGLFKLIEKLQTVPAGQQYLQELSGMAQQLKEIFARKEFDKDLAGKIQTRLEEIARQISLARKTYAYDKIVIPQPQEITYGPEQYAAENAVIVIPENAAAQIQAGAKLLREELHDYFGIDASVITGSSIPDGKNPIVICSKDDGKFIVEVCSKSVTGKQLQPPEKKEGYAMRITPHEVFICGNDPAGAFYAVQTLLQLLHKNSAEEITAPAANIRDWPEISFRGMMLIPCGSEKQVEWTRRAIRRFLALHKFNKLLFGEASSGMIRWKSHPEIAPGKNAIIPGKIKETVAYAKEHCLDVIPLVQSLGHVDSVLKAHPELADSPDPANPGNALCTASPAVKKLLTDLYDEAIALYGKPEYFHIGCDEAYPIGRNPLCQGKPAYKVFTEHLKWCNDYLKSKGVGKVIIWHDLLLDSTAWDMPANSNRDGEYNAVIHPAVKLLPKDIVIAFWSYRNTGDFPEVPYFQKRGYEVLCSPWFDEQNNYDISTATARYNALGVLGTSWTFTSWTSPGPSSLVCAENSWSPRHPDFDKLGYDPRERLQAAMLPPLPSGHAGTTVVPLDISKSCNRSLRDEVSSDGKGWTDEGQAFDLCLLPEGRHQFGGIDFQIIPATANNGLQCVAVAGKQLSQKWEIPEQVKGIIIGCKAESLIFLQSSLAPASRETLGSYIINYEDGSSTTAPIVNCENIFPARKPLSIYAMPEFKQRICNGYITDSKRIWTGFNLAGEEIDLQAYEWINPHPKKVIADVNLQMASNGGGNAIFLLAVDAVMQK